MSALLSSIDGFTVARQEADRMRIRWAITRPLRFYLRRMPLKRGKGIVRKVVMNTCMSEQQTLDITLPCSASISITTSEVIGQHLAIFGSFEVAELEACSRLVTPGSSAFDVGSNLGIFALTMSLATGRLGRVFALEPLQRNFLRLEAHVAKNGLSNIHVLRNAAGPRGGTARLDPAFDPAYASIRAETDESKVAAESVPVVTLDDVWREAGCPAVSFVKIDVEGGEPGVIEGAKEMLAANRPSVLVEAPTNAQLERVAAGLDPFGLRATQAKGFERWNYLFQP